MSLLRALLLLLCVAPCWAWQATAPRHGFEQGGPWSLEQARAQRALLREDLRGSLGLDAPPVWVLIEVEHAEASPVEAALLIGPSWLDEVRLYQHSAAGVQRWTLGDAQPGALQVRPGLGQVQPLRLQPGRNELWLRVHTPDPLLLTPRLLRPEELAQQERRVAYGYAALYGYIGALAVFFGLLWLSLGVQGNASYSVYLLSFIALNVGYTGHGWFALWPQAVEWQRYVNLLLMTCFGAAGLFFGSGYLGLDRRHPRMARGLQVFALLGLTLVPLCAALGSQALAVQLVFPFTLVATSLPLLLGLQAVAEARGRDVAANYYVAAILWGLGGAGVTTATVWGLIPFSGTGFHALEMGVALEATLLALGLAHQIRERERERARAEQAARTDPLTGLPNRRAFAEQAERLWQGARRHQRPLCALALDLDDFKRINDERGHAAGDECLRWLAQQIRDCCRASDLPVRWGGDEFILLLPELKREQAAVLAERLRERVAAGGVGLGGAMSISLGLAERKASHTSLQALLADADAALLLAKRGGRNRVATMPE